MRRLPGLGVVNPALAGFFLYCDTGKISHLLVQAGEDVKKRTLA